MIKGHLYENIEDFSLHFTKQIKNLIFLYLIFHLKIKIFHLFLNQITNFQLCGKDDLIFLKIQIMFLNFW